MIEIKIIPESIILTKMSDQRYFSEEYKDYISNSKLGLLDPSSGGSLKKFLEGFKSGYSDSFELGSAVHAITLQPDEFVISQIRKPGGKLGMFAEKVLEYRRGGMSIQDSIDLASEKAEYFVGKLTPKRLKTAIKKSLPFYVDRLADATDYGSKVPLFLSSTIAAKYEECMRSVENDLELQALLNPQGLLAPAESYNEYAILCEIDVIEEEVTTRVKVKGKLDNFTINHETQEITLNDLKTTGKPASYFMGNMVKERQEDGTFKSTWYNGSFQTYHYYRQMALYLWLLQCAVSHIHGYQYQAKANILLVETIPKFKSKVCRVNGQHIQAGLDEFKQLITLVTAWMNAK